MKNTMLFIMALLFSCHLLAQQTAISGVVLDASDNSPLIGASVLVKGTTTGTVTDFDGVFKLNVPNDKSTIVISCIGYKTQDVSVAGKKSIRVLLKEDAELLDEVVVVGYGTMKKSDLSGASVTMGEDKIKGSIITNLDQSLQGRAAGVTAVATSGAPGSSTSIRVRGQATINANAEPLYVIDGVPVQGNGQRGADFGLGDALYQNLSSVCYYNYYKIKNKVLELSSQTLNEFQNF